MNWNKYPYVLIVTLFCCATIALGQISGPSNPNALESTAVDEVVSKDDAKDTKTSESKPAPKPQVSQECKVCRWFEVQNFTVATRFRTVTDTADVNWIRQNQHREIIDMKFKFDSRGKYSVNTHVSSGYYFNWAYADTNWGPSINKSFPKLAHDMAPFLAKDIIPGVVKSTVDNIIRTQYASAPQSVIDQARPIITAQVTAQVTPIVTGQVENSIKNQVKDLNSAGWNLYARQLYFSAKPIKGVEFQYGGLGILRGASSEMTSYDEDGYIAGGRVSVKRPKNFFFDEISVTYAYLGDIFEPNFFKRWKRLKQSNYHQFLVSKNIGSRIVASVDYTFQDRVDIMREGIKVNLKGSKVLDWARFEMYQRLGDNTFVGSSHVFKSAMGFAFQGEKTIKKATVGGGYSSIDRDYSALNPGAQPFGYAINADRTGVGQRFFGYVKYQITPEVAFDAYLSKPVKFETGAYTWNKNYFTTGFVFDAKKMLQRAGLFK